MKQSQRLHLLIMSALFAAAIAVMTAYLLHIPIPTGGYIHVGDALIYLAACLLPTPHAVGAAMVGAGTPWGRPWWGPGWRICSPPPCGWCPPW